MRKLTVKQKNILKGFPNIYSMEQLPTGVWEQLKAINNTEILWQEVNRFLGDNYQEPKNPMWRILNT